MLLIAWRATARDDLAQIIRYIAFENPPAARRMKRLLEESFFQPLNTRTCTDRVSASRACARLWPILTTSFSIALQRLALRS
ncbi:MAG: type II toxin-antitoxin system RelE/ParE family toxin [Ferrovum myxofaciens]|nr:type II toxin-antitoxin system RelE/ParE family toxin [Ferrovum myxofaciens]QKE39991.1 MAG: type II toxin-antitoxin system RelE/ParE family toxin [Ferrovum myxofaciens]